jgi:hypothetical protein
VLGYGLPCYGARRYYGRASDDSYIRALHHQHKKSPSAASKILKGVPKGGGAGLLKKLHAAKGPVEHQIQRWDSKLDRLTFVTMNGWIDFCDEWLEAADGRNNNDELEEDDILADKVVFRRFYKKLQDVFPHCCWWCTPFDASSCGGTVQCFA